MGGKNPPRTPSLSAHYLQAFFYNKLIYFTTMSQYAYVSLSLIGLCALAGAGVGVGSGVAMMYSQMAQAEQEHKTSGAVAHSPVERKNVAASRGFAAAGARSQ
ncbi:hypothetical protein WJX79_002123 [Trebouxia sp. C0005]